jgi:hypothetical protein
MRGNHPPIILLLRVALSAMGHTIGMICIVSKVVIDSRQIYGHDNACKRRKCR